MLPPCDRGEQGRARQWVARYLSQNPLLASETDDGLAARTTTVRSRLKALKERLSVDDNPATDIVPTLGGEIEGEADTELDFGP